MGKSFDNNRISNFYITIIRFQIRPIKTSLHFSEANNKFFSVNVSDEILICCSKLFNLLNTGKFALSLLIDVTGS